MKMRILMMRLLWRVQCFLNGRNKKHFLSGLCIFVSFCVVHGQSLDAAEWKFESQRPALSPEYFLDSQVLYGGKQTLALQGGGKEDANGLWYNQVSVQPGKYFKFHVSFLTDKVEQPDRAVITRICWKNKQGDLIGTVEYPAKLREKTSEGWSVFEEVYHAPKDAEKAKIELHYRWDPDGIVHFGDMSFVETAPLKPRVVKISTIKFRPVNSKSGMENLEKFSPYITKAAAEKADIVCLPEEMTLVGTRLNYVSASEPIPGPSTKYLGLLAKKNNLYIIAGLLENVDGTVYNTSVLIDRKGNLAGKYRKVCLPNEEVEGGVTPGDSLPVFDTDFGRIGMMICWDVTFPEIARTLSQKGAEIIFLPIWGGNVTLAKARAIENQIYLVSSSYGMATAIFDKEGNIVKQATLKNPVATLSVDLNKQVLIPGLGDFKNRIPGEMPVSQAVRY